MFFLLRFFQKKKRERRTKNNDHILIVMFKKNTKMPNKIMIKMACPVCKKKHFKKWLLYSKCREKFFCIKCYVATWENISKD